MDENAEQRLRIRAALRGPEAFNFERMREAESLVHEEPCGPYVLQVKGGLGSFSVGTSAELLQDGKVLRQTYVSSWVYSGREVALEQARAWAREILGDIAGPV
jgi:hypothetical protein